MRRFLSLLMLLALLGAGYYGVAAPRIALAAIERAASADDVVALAYHLDTVSIRSALQADFAPEAGAPATPGATPVDQLANSLSRAVGGAVGGLVGGTVAELIASPEGILQLLGGVPLRPLFGGALGRNRVPETFARATTGYEWPLAYVMRVPAEADDDALEFVLRPRGVVWKISEVRLRSGG